MKIQQLKSGIKVINHFSIVLIIDLMLKKKNFKKESII